MRRRLLAAGVLLAGVGLARRRTRPEPRVDLFYDDGSTLALTGDEARPLVEIARSALP